MRELMLKLLTYEPFEKISGDEKTYIDAVLAGDINFSQTFPLYDEMMNAFMHFCNQSGDTTKLVSWFNAFYSFSKAGSIGVLCDQATGERTYYPVLFKKVCFYCITEYNFRDADFLKQFGIKPNILNKWEISPRYRKLINRDSYHAINISRNGKKQPYLTKVIKSAFYEASRQEAAVRFFDPATKGWVAPKKEQLLPFVDVFAGSGCVAASVDANEMVVNDFDIGAACFLYSMSNDEKEVRTRLAKLHNSFVSRDLSNGIMHYSTKQWAIHKQKTKKYRCIIDPDFDILMIRLRNNFDEIHNRYKEALEKFVVNFDNPSAQEIQSYYDIGVAWYFLNAIKNKDVKTGGVYSVVIMDVDSYYSYLKNNLNIFKSNKKGVCKFKKIIDKFNGESYKIIPNINLKTGDIKFTVGKNYMKSLSKSHVENDDFANVVVNHADGFIYEDSPYFLTTGYDISFGDDQHKKMLDLLRNSEFKWIFSMQYKPFYMDEPPQGNKDRKELQSQGNPLIRRYRDYYAGFVNNFTVETDSKGLSWYTANPENLGSYADKLYVILFAEGNTEEMMICNFDVRRVLPYSIEKAAVIPFRDFMNLAEDLRYRDSYGLIRGQALKYRANYIKNNYYSGAWV